MNAVGACNVVLGARSEIRWAEARGQGRPRRGNAVTTTVGRPRKPKIYETVGLSPPFLPYLSLL